MMSSTCLTSYYFICLFYFLIFCDQFLCDHFCLQGIMDSPVPPTAAESISGGLRTHSGSFSRDEWPQPSQPSPNHHQSPNLSNSPPVASPPHHFQAKIKHPAQLPCLSYIILLYVYPCYPTIFISYQLLDNTQIH